MRRILAALLALLAASAASEARADGPPLSGADAGPPPYVELERRSVAAGIGFTWGEGTLIHKTVRRRFRISGVGLIDLGIARSTASGYVEHLQDAADFEGLYYAVEAGAAAGVGGSALTMRNRRGVILRLRGDLSGARLVLGGAGLRVAFE